MLPRDADQKYISGAIRNGSVLPHDKHELQNFLSNYVHIKKYVLLRKTSFFSTINISLK